MFSNIVRVLLLFIACLAIVQAYPPSMSRTKLVNLIRKTTTTN